MIVIRFDLLGIVTVCMAVALHPVGYKTAIAARNLVKETK
jgi:hypothetical protein